MLLNESKEYELMLGLPTCYSLQHDRGSATFTTTFVMTQVLTVKSNEISFETGATFNDVVTIILLDQFSS